MPNLIQNLIAHLPDEAATNALGKSLAGVLTPGLVIYLQGDLGAGKTALTRALLQAAGHVGHVRSPTYTLAEPYTVQINGQPTEVIHFDLYRMISADEFLEAGFREYFNARSVCIVEWPEKAQQLLPAPDIRISLQIEGDGRAVELTALSAQGVACLNRLHIPP